MLEAIAVGKKVVLTLHSSYGAAFTLERQEYGQTEWVSIGTLGATERHGQDGPLPGGIYRYRAQDTASGTVADSPWIRIAVGEPVGYSFGNYVIGPDAWGAVLSPDDMRYTYLWGTDLRATNGQPYTDDQIRFFIDAAVEEMERRLNITIKKRKVVCDAGRRGITDYDEEEAPYPVRKERIQRTGMLLTKRRPVLSIERLCVLSRTSAVYDMGRDYSLDKLKGAIRMFNRPYQASPSLKAVSLAVYPYGADQFGNNFYYELDYTAGYENSDKVPQDLRAAIGKCAAIELLNAVGDGLMAGFSSSSLSADGLSESFSSTQSATSAYFGARIKAYEDELATYIAAVKEKFNSTVLGAL